MSEQIDPNIQVFYKPVKKIGSGAYGIVWKALNRQKQQYKALKKNFDAFTNSTDAQRTYREIMFLRQLQHPNIIKLQDILRARNDRDIYLVFEHMDIDLHTLIRQNCHKNESHLQQKHKQYIMYQICKAIYYLHHSNIIHRDLKPSNILVNQNCQAKLCDFGLVRSLEEPQDHQMIVMTDYIATRWYRAPELLLGCKKYAKQVDIWALGCLLGELIRGKPMFAGNSTINQIQKIIMWTGSPTNSQLKNIHSNASQISPDILQVKRKPHKNDFFPHKINPKCMDLISRMLQFDPKKRIIIEDILKHDYLGQFYNDKDIKKIKFHQIKLKLHVSDNHKQSLKDYRQLIYGEIENKNHALSQSVSTMNSNHQNNHLKSQKKIGENYEVKNKQPSVKKGSKKMKTINDTSINQNGQDCFMSYQKQQQQQQQQQQIQQQQQQQQHQNHYNHNNKKYLNHQESKSLGNRIQKDPSLRKKGISLCSKEIRYNTMTYLDINNHGNKEPQKNLRNKIKTMKTIGISQCNDRKNISNIKNGRKTIYSNIQQTDNYSNDFLYRQ